MAVLDGVANVSPRRVLGFGLDRFISVMFLGLVPLRLEAASERGALFWASLASVAFVAALLALASLPRWTRVPMRLRARGRNATVLASVSGLAAAAGGAGCLLCVSGTDVGRPLACYLLSIIVLGVGSGALILMWGMVFSRTGARTTLVEASLGYLVAFASLLPFYAAPPAAQVTFVIAAAGADAMLLSRSFAKGMGAAEQSAEAGLRPSREASDDSPWTRVICDGLFLYGVAMACFGQMQAALPNATLSTPGSLAQLAAALVACALTLACVRRLGGRSEATAYRVAFAIAMAGCLLPLALPQGGATSMAVMLAGETTMLVIISSLLFEFAHRSPHNAVRILGLGIASKVCGDVLARALIEVVRGLGVSAGTGWWTFLFALCIIAEYAFVLTESSVQGIISGVEADPVSTTGTTALAEASRTLAAKGGLTPREAEVLAQLLHGRSSRRIQEELFISESTANTHIRHIYAKLGVHSRQELLDLAENR